MMNNTIKSLGLAAAFMVSGAVYGAGEKTLADVGQTNIGPNDPNVGLINRGDGTYALVFSNAQNTTFTFNSMWTVKEFLVVGGGGAGGGNGGSGGGGGGVIYFTEDLVVADGIKTDFENGSTVSLTVGASGKGGFKLQGTAGGHSTLTLGAKTYTAFGGGGGASYNDSSHVDAHYPVAGADGSTGCGAGGNGGSKTKLTEGTYSDPGVTTMPKSDGYYGTDGGKGWVDKSVGGGGGGAGQVGGDAPSVSQGGKGGDGLPCSITGAEVYYAAGGGGGDSSSSTKDDRAKGGRGGGGNGSYNIGRNKQDEKLSVAPQEAHATGFGCGGGGGNGGGGHTCVGGNGSAGIVVLLIEPVEVVAEKPVVSVLVPEQGANYAKFSVSVVADGLDNTTASEVWGGWAKEGGEIKCTMISSGVPVNGQVNPVVTGLEVGAKYDYKFYAVNEDSVAGDAVEGSFTLDAGGLVTGPTPVITNLACTVVGTTIHVPYCVAWPGTDKKTCSVSLKYGLMADRLTYSVDLGAGRIGNEATDIANLIPGRKYYLQLTADNGAAQGSSEVFAAVIGDNETFPTAFDPRQPMIAGVGGSAGFVAGGDGLIYSGAFSNYVAETVVTFHYSPDGGTTWLTDAAAVTDEGFSGSVESGLTPATDVPYYFTAKAGDFVDCTQVRTFNTKSAGNIQYEVILHNGSQTRTLGMTANVSDIGAGTNSVLCLIAKVKGTGDDGWFVLTSRPMTSPNPEIRIDCTPEEVAKLDYGTTYIVTMAIRSTSFGGQTWEARAKDRDFTPQENTVYTWKDENVGFWDDPENWQWTPDGAHTVEFVAGYPVYGATAQFESGAAATVQVRRAERTRSLYVGDADVTLSFNVPQEGLADAMVSIDNQNEVFPAEGANSVTVTVASKSRFFRRSEPGSQLLISCAGGINTNSVRLVTPRTDISAFRYGAKQKGDKPTELWLDVEAAPMGFQLFVR